MAKAISDSPSRINAVILRTMKETAQASGQGASGSSADARSSRDAEGGLSMRNSAKSMNMMPSGHMANAPQQEVAGLLNRLRSGPGGEDEAHPAAASSSHRTTPPDPRAEPDSARRDLEDRLARALAEQQKIRDHSRRQMQRAVEFAGSRLAADLLDTADNLQRAIASVPDDALADSSLRRLFDGVVATERGLLSAFTKHGIVLIDPQGERFDPSVHEAIKMIADATQPAGTVSAVARPGYLHHGRLLRPAAVHVTASPDSGNKK